jgi:hypothetical protein
MALAKPVSPVLQRDNSLAFGLKCGLPLGEGSGGNVYDLSGQRNNGAFTGTRSGGPFGSAIVTNGSTTEANITNSTSLNVQAGDFTVSVGFTANSLSSYTALFDKGASGSRDLSLLLNAGGGAASVYWALGATVGSDAVGIGTTIVTGTRFHLVATRKGSLSSFYVNGALGGTNSAQTATGSSSAGLSLGLNPSGGGAKFNGTYDHFALWNRALSAGEVAQLFFDPFVIYRPRSRWWEVPAAAGAFTNRPGPRTGPAIPFGLAIGGAKLLELNPIISRRFWNVRH